MKIWLPLALIALVSTLAAVEVSSVDSTSDASLAALRPDEPAGSESGRIFELRTYTTAPGMLTHLHARFRNHTNYLFVKHGMTLVGYWEPQDKEETLVYLLAFPSREARDASFKAFGQDPEWQRVHKESEEVAGGKIVIKVESTFLKATDYSPMQ